MMDRLTDEFRQEWTRISAGDAVICSESRNQVEETLEVEVCPGKGKKCWLVRAR